MPGFGESSPKSKDKRDYSLEPIVGQLVYLIKYGLVREEAIWIGHDWGAGVVWALMAHNPEVCLGVVNMAIPYRMLERGVQDLIKHANRDIYPEDEFPHAQWAYQIMYEDEKRFEKVVKFYDSHVESLFKAYYAKRPADVDIEALKTKPAPTATVLKKGGWFGGSIDGDDKDDEPKVPDIPLSNTLLTTDLHDHLVEAYKSSGFWSTMAYYLNHDVNLKWDDDWAINDGVTSVPVLFVECLLDTVVGTYNTTIMDPMKAYCRKLSTVSIEAGHWVALEKPEEVNAAVLRWIGKELPPERAWPFEKVSPVKKNEINA